MAYIYPFKTIEEQAISAIWNKAKVIPGQNKDGKRWNPAEWRYDICGAPIKYTDHGNTKSDTGWEIDHIKPTAKDGQDALDNLQPLQWKNNRDKGDTYPWSCP